MKNKKRSRKGKHIQLSDEPAQKKPRFESEQRAKSRIVDLAPLPVGARYCDLAIQYTSEAQTRACVQRAIRLGYDCVCINQDIGSISLSLTEDAAEKPDEAKSKKKKKGGAKLNFIPEPYRIDESELDLTPILGKNLKFRQYTRITITMDEPALIHSFVHNKSVAKFDIIAVRPLTEQALSMFSVKPEMADVLSFDPTNSNMETTPWLYKGKLLRRAIDFGMTVELQYACSLYDSVSRSSFLASARQLLSVTSRGLLLTSNASRPIDLRAPFDAANILTIVDCPPSQAIGMITTNAFNVLQRVAARRHSIKGVFTVQKAADVDKQLMENLESIPVFAAELADSKKEENCLTIV